MRLDSGNFDPRLAKMIRLEYHSSLFQDYLRKACGVPDTGEMPAPEALGYEAA